MHKSTLTAGRPSVLRRNLGSKVQKMIYANSGAAGKSTQIVDVDKAERVRFSITDAEVEELAKQALIIEKHYGAPMDIEWAKDGDDGKLYIVQARPETVKSRQSVGTMERYLLKQKAKCCARPFNWSTYWFWCGACCDIYQRDGQSAAR